MKKGALILFEKRKVVFESHANHFTKGKTLELSKSIQRSVQVYRCLQRLLDFLSEVSRYTSEHLQTTLPCIQGCLNVCKGVKTCPEVFKDV